MKTWTYYRHFDNYFRREREEEEARAKGEREKGEETSQTDSNIISQDSNSNSNNNSNPSPPPLPNPPSKYPNIDSTSLRPPLKEAYFLASLPPDFRDDLLQSCPGGIVLAYIMCAETSLFNDPGRAAQFHAMGMKFLMQV
jgi:hypothetical protein